MATLGVQGDRPLNAAGPIDGHLPARDSGNSGGDALHELAAIEEAEEMGGHRSEASWRRAFTSDSVNLSGGLEITASG